MKIERYLVINSKGTCKIHNKYYPTIKADEICIALNLNIPDIIFDRPALVANITIDENMIKTKQICDDVLINTQEAIKQATGLTFAINVVNNEEPGGAG